MRERIWGFIVVMFVPLIPPLIIFLFFGTVANQAEGIILGLKFGGPIAAYVVLLVYAARIYESIRIRSENEILEANRKRIEQFKEIVGEWTYDEDLFVDGKKFKRQGVLTVKVLGNDSHLWAKGQEENDEYSWETNDVFISRHNGNIMADYTLSFKDSKSIIQGFMELQFARNPNSEIEKLRGEFTALGQERFGSVTFTRVKTKNQKKTIQSLPKKT